MSVWETRSSTRRERKGPAPGAGGMRLRPGRAILRPVAPVLVFLGVAVAAASAGCGHVTSPRRPPPLGPEQGPVYDAGAPPETAEDGGDGDPGEEDDRR